MSQYTQQDLDLIEVAARAAGYEVRRYRVRELEVVHVREPGGEWRYFNPMEDDAEAFRLMVRAAVCGTAYSMQTWDTGFAGMRRIVVRAAAECSHG